MWRWVMVLAGLPLGCAQEPGQEEDEHVDTLSCPEGYQDCVSTCVDLQGDGQNCGACGTPCRQDQVCSAGTCQSSCSDTGRTICESSCVDLLTNPTNCGACGVVCSSGQSCQSGVCSGETAAGGTGGGGLETGGAGAGGATGGTGGSDHSPGCGNTAAPKGAQDLTLQLNGRQRNYLLFVPDGYDPTTSIPLIFAWHSAGAPPSQSRRYYKLEPVTGDGAIIVYPEGIDGGWDLGAEGVDVKFFDAMLASLSADYCIDQARVFSTGYSFGGMMSHTLACSRGSKLRAFAPMAGAFFGGIPGGGCTTPVPGWMAHATNDSVVSYSSGEIARDVWIETNGCDTTTMSIDPSPCVAYQCSEAPLQWCAHTQGHEWPNFASEAVWAFFQSQ